MATRTAQRHEAGGGAFWVNRCVMRTILVLTVLFATCAAARAEEPAHRALAGHYAPVVFQDTKSAVLDFITRFDYDGDNRGDNNWRNAYLFDLPGYVYYSVIESSRYYFVTYAFFHPRDYTARPYEGFAPKTEHENDMEGCTLTIEKDGTEFGRVILLETLAHDVFFKYARPDTDRVSAGAMRLDGSIQFVAGRPAIYIEAEGHGVKAAGAELTESRVPFSGVVYRFTGQAAVPTSHRDPEATYDLVSLEDTLWARRYDVGTTYCCADPYAMSRGRTARLGSALNGPIGGCAAKPPWGWDQADDAIAKGDWFRDPLRAYATQLRIENFTDSYTRNPYLEHDGRTASPLCSASTTSKTVKGSLFSTLTGIGRALTSNGLTRGEIGKQASQLFLSGSVLLEWAQRGDLELWDWDKTRATPPAFVGEGLRQDLHVPDAAGFTFTSPEMKAPARYFDDVVLRYRTPLEGLRARVAWLYEGMTDFSDDLSLSTPLDEGDRPRTTQIRLADSPKWDRGKTVTRVRVTIETENPTSAGASAPAVATGREQFALSYLVFDRDAFANTFEQR